MGGALKPGDSVNVPSAPWVHLFVPQGTVDMEGVGELTDGDAVRFTASADGRRVTGVAGDAEVLIWEMHKTIEWRR